MYILSLFILYNVMFISLSAGALIEKLKTKSYNTNTILMPNFLESTTKFSKKLWGPLPISPAPRVTYSTNRLDDFAHHLVKRGINVLNYSATKYMDLIGTKTGDSLKIYSVTSDYVSKIQNFVDHLKENYGEDSSNPVGEELMILNLIEKTCEILYQEQWRLVSTSPMNSTKEFINKIHKLSKKINYRVKTWRNEEIQYICSKFEICRPFPAFSNRIETIILELLKLPDSKLNIFIDILKGIVETNEDFLAIVGGVKGKDMTFKKIQSLCRDISLKESLTLIRVVLSHRHKISKTQLNSRSQATKVLLDIIDKAFLFKRDTKIALTFEHFNKVIKKWNNNKASLDTLLLEQIVNAILKTINSIENPIKMTLINTIISALSTAIEIKETGNILDEISEDVNITFQFTVMKEVSKAGKLERLKEFAENLKHKGALLLKNLNKAVIEENGLKSNANLNIEAAIANYEKNIQNLYEFNARLDKQCGIDKVYMFMDLLEKGCKLIYLEQKSFLQNLDTAENSTLNLFPQVTLNLEKTVFKQTVCFKKNELLYMCKNYGICIPYSVFTYYFEYFIDEILLLPDPEIGMIINLLSEIIPSDNNFLRLINSDEKLVSLVEVLFQNTYHMKQSLIVLRNLMKKRHTLFYAPDFKQKIRIQAVRSLLDIIDKAFYFDHGDQFHIDIYATTKAVRDWGTEKENLTIDNDKTELNLCKAAISNFISTVFKAINYKKNNINRYLMKTIITGSLENVTDYDNLFQDGFKGVYTLK